MSRDEPIGRHETVSQKTALRQPDPARYRHGRIVARKLDLPVGLGLSQKSRRKGPVTADFRQCAAAPLLAASQRHRGGQPLLLVTRIGLGNFRGNDEVRSSEFLAAPLLQFIEPIRVTLPFEFVTDPNNVASPAVILTNRGQPGRTVPESVGLRRPGSARFRIEL